MRASEQLKVSIEALARAAIQPRPEFVRGQTLVPVTAPNFDWQEIANAVSAAVDFKPAAGPWADKLEAMLAKRFEVHAARLTNSGSSANLLAISALMSPLLGRDRLKPGDEVITVAACFPTTVAPIIQCGLVPVFVDVDLATANVDVTQLEAAVSPARTRAVFLAHTLGNPFNVSAVQDFCQKHDLFLIEDACDAVGATWGPSKQPVGSFGDLATLSFYPAHHMTMGEGGAVLVRHSPMYGGALLQAVTSLRDWGRACYCKPGVDNTCGERFSGSFGLLPKGYDHKYVYSHLGYNLKVTDMQAAIGVAQMAKLPAGIKARQWNWQLLKEDLANLSRFFVLPEMTEGGEASPFGFLLSVRPEAPFTRDAIVQHLEQMKVQTRALFAGNLIHHPAMHDVRYRVVGELENTNMLMAHAFWIGVHPGITNEMGMYMRDTIRHFVTEVR